MRGWSARSLIVLIGIVLMCGTGAWAQTSTGMISGRDRSTSRAAWCPAPRSC